jgi:hypothetical protein
LVSRSPDGAVYRSMRRYQHLPAYQSQFPRLVSAARNPDKQTTMAYLWPRTHSAARNNVELKATMPECRFPVKHVLNLILFACNFPGISHLRVGADLPRFGAGRRCSLVSRIDRAWVTALRCGDRRSPVELPNRAPSADGQSWFRDSGVDCCVGAAIGIRAEATRRRWVPRLSGEIARAERFTARGRVVGVAFSRPRKSICHHIPMCVPGSVLYRVNYFFKNTTISRHTYGDLVTQFM